MVGRAFGHAGGRFAQQGFARGGFGRPMFFPGLGFLYFLLVAAFVALVVVAFWRIFSKAGFPGALSLLMLVPFVNVAAVAFLGFASWPALKQPVAPAPAAPAVEVAPPAAQVAATPPEEPAVAQDATAEKQD
jgi:hypothetical protein